MCGERKRGRERKVGGGEHVRRRSKERRKKRKRKEREKENPISESYSSS